MTVEYETPGALGWERFVRFLFCYGLGLGSTVAVLGVVWGMLLFIVPGYVEIFRDFKTSLPTLTMWLVVAAGYAREPLGWMVGILLLMVLPVLVGFFVSWPAERWRRARRGAAVLVVGFLFVVLFLGGTYATLQLPLIKMTQSISGSSGAEGG
jgi:hypothetical protein